MHRAALCTRVQFFALGNVQFCATLCNFMVWVHMARIFDVLLMKGLVTAISKCYFFISPQKQMVKEVETLAHGGAGRWQTLRPSRFLDPFSRLLYAFCEGVLWH